MSSARSPEARRAAVIVAHRFRGWHGAKTPESSLDLGQVDLLRRVLEEAGIHCQESETLQDLAAFMIASPRGIDMIVSAGLSDTERLLAYAHLLAHLLIGGRGGRLMARFEYRPGREPSHLTLEERREEKVAQALAQAMLAGRLEGAPRYLYGPLALPSPRDGMRLVAARTLLAALHFTSMALYWRSPGYQQIRGLPAVTGLLTRVKSLLGEAGSIAA